MTQFKETVTIGLAKFLVQIGTTEDEASQIISEYRKRSAFKRNLDNPVGSSGVTMENTYPFKAGCKLSQSELDQLNDTAAMNREEYFNKFGRYPHEAGYSDTRKEGATVGNAQFPSKQEVLVKRPLIHTVMQELSRARAKHPPMNSLHEGYAIILEELDELWDEIKKQKPDMVRVEKEAVQLAAMVLRLVFDVVRK